MWDEIKEINIWTDSDRIMEEQRRHEERIRNEKRLLKYRIKRQAMELLRLSNIRARIRGITIEIADPVSLRGGP